MKKYSRKQILWAAKVGEVSMIDAEHICSILDTIHFRCPDCGDRLHMQKTGDMITDQFCFSCNKDIPIIDMIDTMRGGEQFYCNCSRAKGLDYDADGMPYCIECQKPVQ